MGPGHGAVEDTDAPEIALILEFTEHAAFQIRLHVEDAAPAVLDFHVQASGVEAEVQGPRVFGLISKSDFVVRAGLLNRPLRTRTVGEVRAGG